MTIGLGILGLVFIVMLGWMWTSIIDDCNVPKRIGLSYGVGLTWISLMMGLLAVIGVPLTALHGWLFIGLPPTGWWMWRRWKSPSGRSPWRRVRQHHPSVGRDLVWWGAAALVALLLAMVAWRAMVKPSVWWDAWDTYATKAKIIYLAAAIPRSMFETIVAPNYPLGIPLQEVWMAWAVGSWDDVAIKLLFPGYLLALLCIVYGELRDRWTPRAAMGGTLFVASLPFLLQHGQEGYTDLPLGYYVLAGAVALVRYVRFAHGADLAMASLFAAGSVWTRVDAPILVVSHSVGLLYYSIRAFGVWTRQSWGIWLLYLVSPAFVWGAWAITKDWLAIPTNLLMPSLGGGLSLGRIERVLEAFVSALFLDGNWLILWALLVLALIYGEGAITDEQSLFLVWPVGIYLGSIAILFVSTELNEFVKQGTVLNRLTLHVAPLAALWVALTYGRWWGLERTDSGKR